MKATRRLPRVLLCSFVLLGLGTQVRLAFADGEDAAACNAAFEEADRILKGSKTSEVDLFAARDQLKVCVRPTCSSWQVADCTKSLVAVGERIPTIAITASDEQGHDMVDVKVLVDGVVLTERIDGRQHEVRPGNRKITCVYPSGQTTELARTVAEGTHATLRCEQPLAKPSVAVQHATNSGESEPPSARHTDSSSPSSTMRWLGAGALGVGVVGLAVGTIFGLKASGSKSDANCDPQNFCDAKPLADARSAATVSTIGFVAGGAFAAGGVLMLVLAPKAQNKVGAFAPVPMAGGGGLLMTRSF